MLFNLTHQERQVILFLVSIALVGTGINFLGKINSEVRITLANYDELFKIDLNGADRELLISVPGIGERLAQRILDYRREKRCFYNLEELKKIKGITENRYKKVKDYFIVK